MKGFVEIISPGLYSTIQDNGRMGYRKYGVPPSGAMDKQSADLANHLLNNPFESALMEITLHGPTLSFSVPTQITITGADISPKLNDQAIACNKLIGVNVGDVLSFGLLRFGARSYLAVKGGFLSEEIMESRSYFTPVTSFQVIRKGHRIPILGHQANEKYNSSVKFDNSIFTSLEIECNIGPEFNILENADRRNIFDSKITVTKDNSRMGYRLDGPEIAYPSNYNMLTSAVLPGTIQLTPSGQLIALMQDCQTTGGYPRILQLTRLGINTLAQKKTLDTFNFKLANALN